jgi:hypothetical protein
LISDCPLFDIQTQAEGAKCKIQNLPAEIADEDCEGPTQGLCGNVPIQSGPGYASPLGGGSGGGSTPTPTPSSTVASSSSTPDSTSATSFSATPVVPTLSYSEGTRLATDSYGGGITIAAVNLSSDPPTPAVTSPAVMAEGALPENEKILSTSVFTSAGAVYEIVIVEEELTVTATGPAPTSIPARRRKRHNHAHNHIRRHGLH